MLKGCSTPGWAWQHYTQTGKRDREGGDSIEISFSFLQVRELARESGRARERACAARKLHKAFLGAAAAAAGGCCEKRFSQANAATASSWKMYAQLNASEKRVAAKGNELPC